MSPIFIIAMVVVWLVVSQAKKAARKGMSAGARAAGRSVRDRVRGRIEGYRDVVRGQTEDVERQLERSAGELEDRWSRAERMLGGQDADPSGADPGGAELGDAEAWGADTEPDELPSTREGEAPRPEFGVVEEEPPLIEIQPTPGHKLTPYETRAAGRQAAAAAVAAAAAAQFARAEAEAEAMPSDSELTSTVELDLTIHALERDLFESARPGFEIEERFREEYRGRRVLWSGLLDRAEGSLGSDRIEVFVHEAGNDPVVRPLRWAFDLPRAEGADLVGQRELAVAIEGTLESCDPYLRQVSLKDARRQAE